MRADRLLSVLLLLQVNRRITARELAHRLEVSERTIHRDMEALSTAGIPVTSERGIGGGWSLLEEYRTDLTGLTEAESQTLFLALPARLLHDLGLHQASQAALIKLFAALPSMHRRDAEYVRQRIYIDSMGWYSSEETVPILPTLQEAIWQDLRLHLVYQRGHATVERLVDPLGLVAKGSIWYLLAAVEGDIRVYRVSRIQQAILTDEPCIRPQNFDLAAYWTQSAADFKASIPRYIVTVRITQSARQRLYTAGRFINAEQIEPPDEDGWLKMRLLFDIKEEACGYILSFGPQIEVLEPEELREQVISLARNVLAFYEENPQSVKTVAKT